MADSRKEPLTDHTEQLGALSVLVTALIAKVVCPNDDTPASEANANLDEFKALAHEILGKSRIETDGYSGSGHQARDNITQRVDEILSALKFHD